jgi:DNA-binding LytR/AlgR family response regulator
MSAYELKSKQIPSSPEHSYFAAGMLHHTPSEGRLASGSYRNRFVVRLGDKIIQRSCEDTALFLAEGKTVFLVPKEGNVRYPIEFTLDQLDRQELDPRHFFRINRSMIIHIDVIKQVKRYFDRRLELSLSLRMNEQVIVSRNRVSAFKKWLGL